MIRIEAWIVRRLVYKFARIAKRGHRPRERNIRHLMEIAGIPVPERVPRNPGSSTLP